MSCRYVRVRLIHQHKVLTKAVQTMRENAEACQTLLTQLGRLMLVVLKPWVGKSEDAIPTELRESLKEFGG